MPLVAPKLKKKMEATLLSAFIREFGPEAAADPTSHKKMAAAISDVALDIVAAILTEAEVAPGIPLAGSLGGGATTGPGKIT